MSYYSQMNPCTFISSLSEGEIDKRVNKIKKENKDFIYCFCPLEEKSIFGKPIYNVLIEGKDFYELYDHNSDEQLANFISKIIDKKYETILSFEDSNGYKWGYFIEKNKVNKLYQDWYLEKTKKSLLEYYDERVDFL